MTLDRKACEEKLWRMQFGLRSRIKEAGQLLVRVSNMDSKSVYDTPELLQTGFDEAMAELKDISECLNGLYAQAKSIERQLKEQEGKILTPAEWKTEARED